MDVTPRTIRNWRADDLLPDLGSNGSDPAEEVSLSDAKRRKEVALAEKHELDAAKQRGDLIEKSHMVDVLLRIRRIVDALPSRRCQEVARLLDAEPREVVPLLEEMSDLVLDEIRMELERWAAEGAVENLDTPLPEDTPHRSFLVRHGCETIEDVEALDPISVVAGIGETRADEIRDWLDEQ